MAGVVITGRRLWRASLPEIKYPNDTSYLTFSGKVYGVTPSQLRGAGELFAIIQGQGFM